MKISVLIPVYNAEAFLKETLESVLAQTLPPFEIIALDDGSTDGSAAILEGRKEIRFIKGIHGGVNRARNILVREAAGDIVAFMDADDLWDPRKLEKQAAFMEQHPECDIAACATETFLDPSVTEPTPRQKELAASSFPLLLQASLIRRSVFERFLFNESMANGGDTDWFMRVMTAGVRICRMKETLCRYRIHGSNISLHANTRKGAYLQMIAAAARKGKSLPPDLSVIIPAYNAEKYLKEAVDSVKSQVLPAGISRMEILVADDGSTDGTADLAESLPGVRCLRGPHKCAAAARNRAVRAARGRFLLFLDADDLLTEGAAAALYRPFEEGETTASFGLAADFVSGELEEKDVSGIMVKAEAYKGFFSGCVLVKKSVFEEGLFFDESLSVGETVDWLLRFKEKYGNGSQVEALTCRRRIHLSNTGRRRPLEERTSYAAILRQRLKGKG